MLGKERTIQNVKQIAEWELSLLLCSAGTMELLSFYASKVKPASLQPKVHIVQAIVFPLVTYGCESWTMKRAKRGRTDAFELWCWRMFLRVPWTARRSNQSILKEINLKYSLERLMLKLKLQYFDHLMQRTDWELEKTLMLGKIEGKRKRGWRRMRWLDSIINSMNMNLSKLWWLSWLRIHLQCRRPGFNPCVGKIPWKRVWQPTPVFLPREFPWKKEPGGLQSMGSHGVRHNWSN